MNQHINLKAGVVGAGIIGLSAAYCLQKLGARVTLIDKSFVGNCIPNLALSQVMSYCRKTQFSHVTERGVAQARAQAIELGYSSQDDNEDEASVPDQQWIDQKRTVLLSDFAARCTASGVHVLEADATHSTVQC